VKSIVIAIRCTSCVLPGDFRHKGKPFCASHLPWRARVELVQPDAECPQCDTVRTHTFKKWVISKFQYNGIIVSCNHCENELWLTKSIVEDHAYVA
jgi:hypothetical protein